MTYNRKAPKGYRLLRIGEVKRLSDIRWSFNYDALPVTFKYSWGKPDNYDRQYHIGLKFGKHDQFPWARRVKRSKK